MSFIKDIFSPPEIKMPSLPKYPTKKEEKKKLRRGATSKETILTSPLGLEEGKTKRKTLLGE